MNKFENDVDGKDWLDAELADTLDEDYELELSAAGRDPQDLQ